MHGSLATRLRVLRAERGLTVRQVAERSGVAKETVSQVERGERHPYDRTLAKLARAYGVPVEELLGETESPLAGAPSAGLPSESGAEADITQEDLREWGLEANPSQLNVLNQLLHYHRNPPGQIYAVGTVRKEGEPVDFAAADIMLQLVLRLLGEAPELDTTSLAEKLRSTAP
jgi:transcriptional regulator with XRE-family HTH domain